LPDGSSAPDLFRQGRKPLSARRCIRKANEFVARCQRGRAGDQEVLNVLELQRGSHRRIRRRHCISSSTAEKACRRRSAFLISSLPTYGYSPYSMKLGRWWSRKNLVTAAMFVFQSSGKPSRFTNAVVMPVSTNSATASSRYLSKSVSKMPWYMK